MAPPAHAALVTFQAVGTITAVTGPVNARPFALSVGDTITVQYRFEATTPASFVTPFYSSYQNAIESVQVLVGAGSVLWAADPAPYNAINIDNEDTGSQYRDVYTMYTGGDTAPSAGAWVEMQIRSSGSSPPAGWFSSTALPVTPFDPGAFPGTASGLLGFQAGDPVLGNYALGAATFSIEQLVFGPPIPLAPSFNNGFPPYPEGYPPEFFPFSTSAIVPLPATAWLYASGLGLLLGGIARRRSGIPTAGVDLGSSRRKLGRLNPAAWA